MLRITDRGRGFAPERLVGAHGLGLAGMSERLRLVGGGLRLESVPKGGTILEAWLPSTWAADGVPRVAPSLQL